MKEGLTCNLRMASPIRVSSCLRVSHHRLFCSLVHAPASFTECPDKVILYEGNQN
jgi:hypothetical protein